MNISTSFYLSLFLVKYPNCLLKTQKLFIEDEFFYIKIKLYLFVFASLATMGDILQVFFMWDSIDRGQFPQPVSH